MLISEDKKYIFIHVPKTGGRAIEKRLKEIDESVVHNKLPTESGNWVPVARHIPVSEVCQILGRQAEEFTFIAFLRHPLDLVASKYYFYRCANPFWIRRGTRWRRGLDLRVTSAKLLPLWLWAGLYPYRSSSSFVLDRQGRLAVDKIGYFHRLQEDFRALLAPFGYPPEALDLTPRNTSGSQHAEPKRSPLYRAIVHWRSRDDLALWQHGAG